MKKIDVADDLSVRASEPGEFPFPIAYVSTGDGTDYQIVPVWPREIKPLIAALTEIAVFLADVWNYEHKVTKGEPDV